MKKYIVVGCLLTLSLHMGCVAKRAPIKVTQDPVAIQLPSYVPTKLEVREAIFAGVYDAGWRPQDRAPGLIYAKKRMYGETVTVEVDYTASSYLIKFTESTDEDYSKKSGNVPRLFSSWAKTLRKHIDEKIALIGTEKPIHQVEAFPRIAPGLPGEPILLEREVQTAEAKRRAQREAEEKLKAEAADKATVPMSDDATDVKAVTAPQESGNLEAPDTPAGGALSPLPSALETPSLTPVENNTAASTGVQERDLPESGASEKSAAGKNPETQPPKVQTPKTQAAPKVSPTTPAVVHATPVILHAPVVQKVEAKPAENSTQPKDNSAPKPAPKTTPVEEAVKPAPIVPEVVEAPKVEEVAAPKTPTPQVATPIKKEDLPEVGSASGSSTEVRGKVQETYLSAPEQY